MLAHAEDAAPSGRAASLVSLAPSELVLKSQTVEFAFLPEQRAWGVSAHYELSNPSNKPLAVQLGVPEYPCTAESENEAEIDDTCDPAHSSFAQLEATVAGKTQRLSKRRMPRAPAGAVGPEQVWALPLRVNAGESVPVELHYTVPAVEPADGGFGASYLLRNQHWAKPIGRATFKFAFPAYSCLVVEPEQPARKARRVVMRGERPWLELVYEAYVWTPRSDLALFFAPCVVVRDTELTGCPAAAELTRFFYPADADEEVEPISETGLRARLAKLSDAELESCRDSVFGAYAGYFQPDELKKLPTHVESSRHYTAPLLTAADWAWVHFLDQRVAERKTASEAAAAAKRKASAAAAAAHGGCGCSLASPQPVAAGLTTPPAAALSAPLGLSLVLLASRVLRRRRAKRYSSAAAG
jgi:hypothetical protein